ncbi:hypothetical protein Cme02nite_08020 [Catellatospora methionotrophica]|uniref:Uncharacterized protein n=1 Tax=Catellatospora methionotrophica TaxID=121620 RepID=A0A8J3L4Y9_9ACTN|nr:hypothetical protein [Catellatospora methionotrophica]GIG12470.1 hypothetical protein Cme02nite_08020 [Catellatospora methionotrophica]
MAVVLLAGQALGPLAVDALSSERFGRAALTFAVLAVALAFLSGGFRGTGLWLRTSPR